MFGSIGFAEVLFLGVIAILIWGKDLPAVARKIGALYVRMRRALNDMSYEIAREIPSEDMDVQEDLEEADSDEPSTTTDSPDENGPEADEEDSEEIDEGRELEEPTSDEPSTPPDSPAGSEPEADEEDSEEIDEGRELEKPTLDESSTPPDSPAGSGPAAGEEEAAG